jgi:hypothetical protein
MYGVLHDIPPAAHASEQLVSFPSRTIASLSFPQHFSCPEDIHYLSI